jgi:hypothetical protein
MKENCKEMLGVDCIEKVMNGLNISGDIKTMSDGDLAKLLSSELKSKK